MSSKVGRHTTQPPPIQGERDSHPTLVAPDPQDPTCHTGCADLPNVRLQAAQMLSLLSYVITVAKSFTSHL